MINHWSPQHAPTLDSLGIRTWTPLIQVFKLVGLLDKNNDDHELEGQGVDNNVLSASSIESTLKSESVANKTSTKSTSLACILRKQLMLWLRTLGNSNHCTSPRSPANNIGSTTSKLSLFEALLTDSLKNLYSIALGERLPCIEEVEGCRVGAVIGSSRGFGKGKVEYLPAPVLMRACSYEMGSSPVTVRQSLHPFHVPSVYGEVLRLPGAQGLRITLDAR